MPRVTYHGPGHVLHAFGKSVARGADEDFDEAEVRSLQAQPHLRITITGETTPPKRSRRSAANKRLATPHIDMHIDKEA